MTARGAVPGARRKANPRLSLVIPALNEARNLELVLPDLPPVHEVILVDGGSVDGTVDVARAILPGVVTVSQTRTGKGNALAAGFAKVTGDIVVMFDADGSADPDEIESFVAALIAGADLAKGSRFLPGGGSGDITRFRRVGNHTLGALMNAWFGTRFSDLCYGYNAFWADLLPLLDLPDHELITPRGAPMLWGDGFEIESLIHCRLAGAGLEITEVPSVERQRIYGASNLRAVADGWRVLQTLRAERRRLRRARDLESEVTLTDSAEGSALAS